MSRQPTDNPSYPGLEPILDAIAQWIQRYRYASGLADKSTQCGRDEVARIAHELGVSPDELASFASKGPGAASLLQKMLVCLKN